VSIEPTQVAATMKQVVPWIETNGVDFVEVTSDRVVASLPDVPEQRNHLGGPHAAVIFGLGETASGAMAMVAFADLLSRGMPVVASSEIRYRKLATGDLTAEAVLGRDPAEVVRELESGARPEFPVKVTVRNADGATTAELTVTWTLRPNRTS
jgi:acyl-coenzyme A thioesterase PaaI-like protein